MFIVIFGFAVVIWGDTLFSKYYPSYAFASFVIGGCISYHKIDVFDFVRKYRSIFWTISISALLGGFAWSIYHDSIAEPASVVKFLTIPMFYLMFDWISKVMRHRLVSKFVSPLSFTLYASHIFFTTVIMHSLGAVFPKILGSIVIVTILTITLSLLSVIVMWHVGNKMLPRIFLLLDGKW